MREKVLKKAFTLVELIIVIAIVAILAVISFLWLNKWLGNARDASRKGNLANLDKALQIYLTEKTTLPKPDNNTMLYASGIEYVIGYQGYFGETARDSVGNIDKAPKDGNNYFTYYVNSDLNKYQLMAYMENPVAYNPSTANAENYAQRYIYVRGDKLGILTDSDKNPLQDFGGTGFNVLSGESNYTAYFDNSKNASGTGKQLFTYYYNQTKSLLQNTGFAQYDDNLVFYSNMEDLDGSLLKDLSQNGNNGICYSGLSSLDCGGNGGPEIVQGKIGKAMRFFIPNYVEIPRMDFNNGFSINSLVKREQENLNSAQAPAIYTSPYTLLRLSPEGEQSSNPFEGFVNINSSRGSRVRGNPADLNIYYVATITRDRKYLKLYVNGNLKIYILKIGDLNTATGKSIIGAYVNTSNSYYGRFFNGLIDEVRIYNRALSDDEVKALYIAN